MCVHLAGSGAVELMSREMTGRTLWAVQEKPVEIQQYLKRTGHKARLRVGAGVWGQDSKRKASVGQEGGAHQRQLRAWKENDPSEGLWCLLFGH